MAYVARAETITTNSRLLLRLAQRLIAIVRFFFSDLYRFVRITRFAPIVTGTYCLGLLLPDQIPEVIMAYGKADNPIARALPATAAMYLFCAAVLVYTLEMVIAHVDVRPYSTLNARRLAILCWSLFLGAAPAAAMLYTLQFRVPESTAGKFHMAAGGERFFEVLSEFSWSHFQYIIVMLLCICLLYWRLLKSGSSARSDTNPIRRSIFFRFCPVVCVGCVAVVWRWLDHEPSRIVELGSLYLLHEFFLVWTVLFASALYYLDRYRVPVMTIFLLWWVTLNLLNLNDYHGVRPIASTSMATTASLGLSASPVQRWLAIRADRARSRGQMEVPVYLIAAQGGGLYAAYHASLAIASIFEASPIASENTFAISAVSGGAVGSAIVSAFVPPRGSELPGAKWNCAQSVAYWRLVREHLGRVFDGDFLGVLITAGLFRDTIREFVPISGEGNDRSFYFERALIDQVKHNAPPSLDATRAVSFLEEGIASGWKPASDVPALFFNVTSADSGHRQYIGPFNLEADSKSNVSRWWNKFFEGKDFPVLRAAGVAARFPYAAPPATLRLDNTDAGRYVDGAYVENSGVATILDVVEFLRAEVVRARRAGILGNVSFVIKIITLANEVPTAVVGGGFVEFYTPLKAFAQTRVARGEEFGTELRRRAGGNDGRYEVLEFKLLGDGFRPGLGWLLSTSSLREIEKRVQRDVSAHMEHFRVPSSLCVK